MNKSQLREQYLECVKASSRPGKVLVSKSAAVAPDIVCIRGPNNEVMGFSTIERLGIDHPEVAKHLVSKSAGGAADPNACFDSLFFGGPEIVHTIEPAPGALKPHQAVVSKSVPEDLDDNSLLDGMVPSVFRSWPI